jgi:hypothetical protein
MDVVELVTPPLGGSCSPPADFDGGGSVGMVGRPVQSTIHRRLRATPDRLSPPLGLPSRVRVASARDRARLR